MDVIHLCLKARADVIKRSHKEYHNISEHRFPVTRNEVRKQRRRGHINLVRGADEDEGGDDDVEDGVVGYEHENAVSVGCQPDVVLRDEQLKQKAYAHVLRTNHKTG